jgi:hypothetical protein
MCNTQKGKSNHWWLYGIVDSKRSVIHTEKEGKQFLLVPWDELVASTMEEGHVCSQECAAKALSKFMNPPPEVQKLSAPHLLCTCRREGERVLDLNCPAHGSTSGVGL